MKKLILNLIMPGAFLLISFNGISGTPVVTNELIVPAVIYKGETIPSVNLPTVKITGKRNNVKVEKSKTNVKGSPERYGPQQKIRRNSPTM